MALQIGRRIVPLTLNNSIGLVNWCWEPSLSTSSMSNLSSKNPHDPCGSILHTWIRHHNTFNSGPSSKNSDGERSASVDPKEAAKFASMSSRWWDPSGPFAPLHRFNPARCKFIRGAVCSIYGLPHDQPQPLRGLKALDVGCGGGILAESLARMGAEVHAIDITEENVFAASQHALLDPFINRRIKYECVPAEALVERDDRYDLVLSSEVLEHVRQPDQFVKVLSQLMNPTTITEHESHDIGQRGSLMILSTLNRTLESYAVAIVAAEHITKAVPLGTHDWRRFITPQEMVLMANQAGLETKMMAGIGLSAGGTMKLTQDLGVNYIASFSRKISAIPVSGLEACNIVQ